jgi:hypothetical protein
VLFRLADRALFVSLGESYAAFGRAMALSAVVGAFSGMFLGRLIDAGHGAHAAWIALAALLPLPSPSYTAASRAAR